MTNTNERNVSMINETVRIMQTTNDGGVVNLSSISDEFREQALYWNNITIKVMDLYVKLFASIEVIDANARYELTNNIIGTLNTLVETPEYKYFEAATLNIFKDIRDDINVARNFGILNEDDANELLEWTESEIKETSCIRENVLENFRFVNIEFSYHNHYMRLDGIHYNGLTNDTFINKILDKLYEDDANCAQILRRLLEERGMYTRRVANILSEGTMIELYLEFENTDGCGKVRFIRSGGETNCATCFNKQEGFDVSPENEAKDPVIERCMNEIFNIINIVETLK